MQSPEVDVKSLQVSKCSELLTQTSDPASSKVIEKNILEKLQHDLKDALEKNLQWQTYNAERENYVTNLLLQFNQMSAELTKTREQLSDIKQKPDQLQIEQRRHFDKLLVEARLQLKKRDLEVARLEDEISCLKKNFNKEIDEAAEVIEHWRTRYNKQKKITKSEALKEKKTENVKSGNKIGEEFVKLQNLQTELKTYLDDFRDEQRKLNKCQQKKSRLESKVKSLEKRLENIQKFPETSVEKKENICKNCSKKIEEKIEENRKGKMKEESRKAQRLHLSYQDPSFPSSPVDADQLSQSFDPSLISDNVSTTMLKCPGCGEEYSCTDHLKLLKHIDFCVK